jgi:hypothetical protein
MPAVSVLPAPLDLDVYAGATWAFTMTWEADGEPVDLTGCTALMDIRSGESGALLATLTSEGVSPTITLGGAAGTVTFNVPAATTAGWAAGDYEYDLLITDGDGVVTALVAGVVKVRAGVTQP